MFKNIKNKIQSLKISKSNTLRFCIAGFCALFAVIFLTFFIISKNNLSYTIIENTFNQLSGLKLEILKPDMSLNLKADVNFKADEINIYNKNKTAKFIEIKNTQLTLKPLNLIFKKINIKKLKADNVKINISQDKNGKIEFFEILKNKNLKLDSSVKITKFDSEIKNFDFNFNDNFNTKTNVNVSFKDSKINLSKKKKIFEVLLLGTIKTTNNTQSQICDVSIKADSKYPFEIAKNGDLKLDIKLINFNLTALNNIAKKYISKDILSLYGNLNLNIQTEKQNDENYQKFSSKISNLKIKTNENKLQKTIIPYKEDISAQGLFNFEKNNLEIKDFKLTSNDLNINTKGKIEKIISKKPDLNFEVNILNTQLNNFVYLIPDNTIYYNPKGIPTLKRSNFFALLNGNMNIKLLPLNIEGNLKAGNIHIPNYPKPSKQNDLNVYFMKDKARIYTRVYTPQNEYVTIDGISSLDDSLYGKYSVTSTPKIDLSFAKLYLVPLKQIIGFDIGPVPIMDIAGYGNIDIKTQGTIYDAQIFGTFKANNAKAKIEGLDAQLTNGVCELVFNNRDLIFKKIQGKIENADFLLTGKGNTKGEVDLTSDIKNITTSNALKIFKNSLVSKPFIPLIQNIAAASGKMNAQINLKGIIKDYEDKNFINDLALSGNINLKNNKIILQNNLKANSINGTLNFGNIQKANFDFNINNSRFAIILKAKQSLEKISKGEYFDFESMIVSPKISSKDILDEIISSKLINKSQMTVLKNFQNTQNLEFYSKLNLISAGRISLRNIDLANVRNKGALSFLNNNSDKDDKMLDLDGNIKFENTKMFFNNINLNIGKGNVKITGDIDKFLSKTPDFNINAVINDVLLDNFKDIVPNIKLNNCVLKNGRIYLKHNDLKLNNINISYNSMPVFVNAQMRDIFKNKYLNADFSTILNETTTDNIINPFLIYPLKIKGEIPLSGNFRGKSNNYIIDIFTKIPKNSDISFSGANIGDLNYNREISGKIEVNKNIATISNLKLVKYITNQNNKINPLTALKVNGQLKQENNDLLYKNFKIATMSPMNVRTLNMIFKKSLLKKGNFECAINLDGNVKTPKITGNVKLQDLDIPLYDTKINNIDINITEKFIDGIILAHNKQSDLNLTFKAHNKLTPPYIVEKMNIESNILNIQDILNSAIPQNKKTDISLNPEISIKPQDITIKDGLFSVVDVSYNNIKAKNVKAKFDFSKNIFNLRNLIFEIAKGTIEGSGKYNLDNTILNLEAKINDCDSNNLTKDFLNLTGQIYGKINGAISLSAKGLNTPDNIKNIKSNVDFIIYDGKMPKLGSLEYLLRAGNIIKNGLLSLSLNNVIQILTPYKTGEFEKIKGKLTLGNGEVKNLEILSQGKNLSLYLEGNYDILSNFADIKIYGKLSQNVSNALGTIGNASIMQFIESFTPKKARNEKDEELKIILNKIPNVESQTGESESKYFKAKVLGDINKDNYIKSFNWLQD